MRNTRVIVVGGGPGGYVAAIRAAQLGADVKLIEKERLGGTCLNVGCIPTKVLLHTSEVYSEILYADKIGINVEGVEVNWGKLHARKNSVINQLVSGVGGLLKANRVEVIQGSAEFSGERKLRITKTDGSQRNLEGDAVIVATGSIPFIPPIKGVELEEVIDSTGALNLETLPKSITIVGGGVIGVEFATIFNTLGCEVSVVEMLPNILPVIDKEIASIIKTKLVKEGVKIYNNARVESIEKVNGKLKTAVTLDGKGIILEAEKVLVAIGRRANLKGLKAEEIGIKLERGCVVVDERMETSIKGIYAVGDCTGKNMLAHVASEQGISAAENIMGYDRRMDYRVVPACVYTSPEIASVGLTEEQAREKRIDYRVGKFPLAANGKSLIIGDTEGMIKVLIDKKYNEVIGFHMIGPRATDLITEAAIAIKLEATSDEIINTIHAHPTIGEAVKEAVLASDKIAIHMIN